MKLLDSTFQPRAPASLALADFGVTSAIAIGGWGNYINPHTQEPAAALTFAAWMSSETAQQFLDSGNFAWNAGIFVWKAQTILDEIQNHKPGLGEALKRVGEAWDTPAWSDVLNREFPKMERTPIDRAVMEKAANVKVLEVLYDWNDVGDWRALQALIAPDESGNTIQGNVLVSETSNSILISDDGGLIAALGLDNVVVVQSSQATLVARKDQLDKLKALVESLGERGLGAYL